MADLYSAADVFAALGVVYKHKGKNIHVPCPVCGSRRAFVMQMEKNVGHCFECSCRLNQISYYASARGITNEEANQEMKNYLHIPTQPDYNKSYCIQQQEFAEESAIQPLKARNEIYSLFYSVFSLQKADKEALEARGLTEEEINKLKYLSFRETDWARPARCLYKEAEKAGKSISLKGIPGFYKSQENEWLLREMKAGIMMPYRDMNNLIQGWQIRKDDKLIKTFYSKEGKAKKENKCTWLSSIDMNEGCSSGSFIHYAVDFVYSLEGKEIPLIRDGIINLTEGAMKGDIIHLLSGEPVICMAGVKNHTVLEQELKKLKKFGVKEVRDLCDMDYFTKETVRNDCNRNMEIIENVGLKYRRMIWETNIPNSDKQLKGYDDYLMYHKRGILPK